MPICVNVLGLVIALQHSHAEPLPYAPFALAPGTFQSFDEQYLGGGGYPAIDAISPNHILQARTRLRERFVEQQDQALFYDAADEALDRNNLSFIPANAQGPGGTYYRTTKWPMGEFADLHALPDEPDLPLDDVFLAIVASCHSAEAYNASDVSIGRELFNKGVDGIIAVNGRIDEMFAEFWSLRFWQLAVSSATETVEDIVVAAHEAAIRDMLAVFKLSDVERLERKFTDPATGDVLVNEAPDKVWKTSENGRNAIPVIAGTMFPARYGQKSSGE